MANIKDVAKLAGVSTATVSNALNHTKPVSAEKRERILKAAEELHYIPSTNARDLKKKSSRVIGVILTDIRSQFHVNLFIALSSSLQAAGYTVQIAFTDEVISAEQKFIEDMISSGVDGIILVTCQTERELPFWNKISTFPTPLLFIERRIPNITVNYIGFHNYLMTQELVTSFLEKGYRDIVLFCGSTQYSSEADCIRGYEDAFIHYGLDIPEHAVFPVSMLKENAMESCLGYLHGHTPQVILGSSREILDGILHAVRYNDIPVPEKILVAGLGEENWDHSFKGGREMILSRPSSVLGEITSKKFLELIEEPSSSDPFEIELKEYSFDKAAIPPASDSPQSLPAMMSYTRQLNLLLIKDASEYALTLMLPHFERNYGVKVRHEIIPQTDTLGRIQNLCSEKDPSVDIFMYDNHWLNFLVQNQYLADLSPLAEETDPNLEEIVPELKRNYRNRDKMYGIPYTGGSQLLFFRQDLFDDPSLNAQYQKDHTLPLRPPRTWTEFNHIARFFTKSFNTLSPTAYGATFAGKTDEIMSCEILIRLWGLGGSLWDSYGRPTFNTNANINAYRILRECLDYVSEDSFAMALDQTVESFLAGNAAMLISFSEYAPLINARDKQDFQRTVGYYHIPGRKTVSAGYCFGLNPYSEARESAFEFLRLIGRKNTNYLFTLFNGSPHRSSSFHNHELRRLYPWLYYTEKSIQFSQERTPPMRANRPVIPPNTFEKLVCSPLRRMAAEGLSAEEALADAQREALRVFAMYGVPVSTRF